MRIGQNGNLEKVLFDWFKRMPMNNLPVSRTILREKAVSYAQNSKLRDFIIQMDGLKAIPGEEKSVTPEMTSSW